MGISNTKVNSNNKIEIQYNPFTYEVKVLSCTCNIDDDSAFYAFLKDKKNKAFYLWYDELLEAIENVFDSKSFEITFLGREVEKDDLLEVIERKNIEENYNIEFKFVKKEINPNIVNDLKEYIDEINSVDNETLKKKIKQYKAVDNFKDAMNSEVSVSVVATMSAGKSTLLNALLGEEILPSKNEACTATICKIKDNKQLRDFQINVIEYDKMGNENVLVDWTDCDNIDIKDLNEKGNEENSDIVINIEGNISGMKNEDIPLVLVDTPGTNNSQNDAHREKTYNYIKDTCNNPLILYVLNSSQLQTNDDARLLREIAQIIKTQNKICEERFIFVLNKIDHFDTEKEDLDGVIDRCKKYLASFGIEKPNIFPLSAEAAKLARLKEKNKMLTRTQKADLLKFNILLNPDEEKTLLIDNLKYASISKKDKEQLYNIVFNSENENEILHITSGMAAIECYINNYINKYGKAQKIKDSISTIKQILEESNSIINSMSNKTAEEKEELKRCLEDVKEKIENQSADKIDAVKEKISKINISSCASELNKKMIEIEEMEENIDERLSENRLTEDRAYAIVEEIKDELEEILLSTKTDAIRVFNENIQRYQLEIKEEVNKIVDEIIEDIDIDSNFKNALETSFSLETELKLIRKLSGVNAATYEEETVVGSKVVGYESQVKWYNPFTWLKDPLPVYEDIIEKKRYVDLNIIKEKLNLPTIVANVRKNIDKTLKMMNEQLSNYKNNAMSYAENASKILNDYINEQEQLLENVSKLDDKQSEYSRYIKEVEKFYKKLNEIVD